MDFEQIALPEAGPWTAAVAGRRPAPGAWPAGVVAGDASGPDLGRARPRVRGAAVEGAYGSERERHRCERSMVEEAAGTGDDDRSPTGSLDAVRARVVAIKEPLTTATGVRFRSGGAPPGRTALPRRRLAPRAPGAPAPSPSARGARREPSG